MKPEERSVRHSLEAHLAIGSTEDEQPVENEECPEEPVRAGARKGSGELLGSAVADGVGNLSKMREYLRTRQLQLAEDGGGIGPEEGFFFKHLYRPKGRHDR